MDSSSTTRRPTGDSAVKTTPVERKYRDDKGIKHINDYVVGRRLGSGRFSTTKEYDLVDPSTGTIQGRFAGKRYRKAVLSRKKEFRTDPETRRPQIYTKLQEVWEEIKVLSLLNNPYCLRVREVLESGTQEDGEDGKLCIITNLQACGAVMSLKGNGGSEQERFVPPLKNAGTIPEAVCRCIVRDVAKGLLYLHEELNIAHRDVKPDNMLMGEDGRVQIGDMGSADFMDAQGRVRHTKGTYMFMAPESMRVSASPGEPYEGHGGRAADVWALGISLYAMLFGELPFKATACMEQLFSQLAEGAVKLPKDKAGTVSEDGKAVLLSLLQPEVKDRMTLPALLEHPWIKEADTSEAAKYARLVLDEQATSSGSD
ncbi:putative protein kinase, PfPK7 homolog [Neospora caninum Liverpool]|uniref:Protein kinase, PfPK7 homolog, putative n=1 Tax=Neospora caninum (strain Liverpool) TaxID=572307 RepID=F0VFQ6_NEOCL|nr:putative protein kinase, PfPK7 homolog [Neospora caninum Liverpool]CBZ52550.1 putative protein kinase, PfPK7 homolog [Neospora caninum Liverpool]CEL66526.1 TPA: protein kinase, PfPK7 homolog, putative [Neospora caninum Liverpool]|eukprot:XP_003882582.1 putative protein kinase, PfPK7 homolog [Neospora caninum Liverpool]